MRPEDSRTLTRQRESEKRGGGGGGELNRESQWCSPDGVEKFEAILFLVRSYF